MDYGTLISNINNIYIARKRTIELASDIKNGTYLRWWWWFFNDGESGDYSHCIDGSQCLNGDTFVDDELVDEGVVDEEVDDEELVDEEVDDKEVDDEEDVGEEDDDEEVDDEEDVGEELDDEEDDGVEVDDEEDVGEEDVDEELDVDERRKFTGLAYAQQLWNSKFVNICSSHSWTWIFFKG